VDKTIYSTEYVRFLNLLRQTREQVGLTQVELARRLDATQSFISKCERGERRIDIVELQAFCAAMGISLAQFVATFEAQAPQPHGPVT
jgi:transcriptional regulator with XRE-family HTH domain